MKHNGSTSPGVLVVVITASIGALAGRAGADEVTLKSSVRLPAGATHLYLSDIALLTGPRAVRHGQLLIAPAPLGSEVFQITVGEVRRALDAAGVHWGKIQLNGATVVIRPPPARRPGPPLAMTAASIEGSDLPAPLTDRPATPPTADLQMQRSDIRGAVTQRVVEALGVNPAEVRLLFDHRDALFLDTAGQGLQFEIQPLGNLTSDRIHLSVRTWQEGRVQETRFVSVRPMIRTDVAVLGVDIPRGAEIKGENLLSEQRWLSLSLSESMIAIAQATGRKAARKLRAGQVISRRDLKHPMLIKRGDRVMVQCLVGGLVIRVEAEARSNAAEGEPVELRKLGQRDTFFAIASETGLATLDLTR